MALCQGLDIWHKCVFSLSYPFQCGYLLICSVCRSQLVSEFLSEEIVLCVAAHPVYLWEEGSSGIPMSPSFNPAKG